MTGLKILAVDSHDLHWRRACEALNQDDRFDLVCVVDSVDQALNCLEVVDPDVVMVDITLPGAVTMDVASRMQEGASRATLIAATNNVDDASLSLAINIGARACVDVEYSDALLKVTVTNDGSGVDKVAGRASGGRGIVGMRERTAMFGGEFEAAPSDDGGWRVQATFPIESSGAVEPIRGPR